MKKLTWRLGKLPSPDEVRELVKDKIITQEEAREILFSETTEEDRDKKSLESEIKFLREMVENLSKNNASRIIEVIKEIKVPYYHQPWYHPYQSWCSTTNSTSYLDNATLTSTGLSMNISGTGNTNSTSAKSFTDIQTF